MSDSAQRTSTPSSPTFGARSSASAAKQSISPSEVELLDDDDGDASEEAGALGPQGGASPEEGEMGAPKEVGRERLKGTGMSSRTREGAGATEDKVDEQHDPTEATWSTQSPAIAVPAVPTVPAPTQPSPASSPTSSHSASIHSGLSHDSGSPLIAVSARGEAPRRQARAAARSATCGAAETFVRSDAAEDVNEDDGGAGNDTPRQVDQGAASGQPGLTAEEKAVLLRRARKLEKLLGSTLREGSLAHSRQSSLASTTPGPTPALHRRLSDPALSPSKASFAASPATSSPSATSMGSPERRRRSLALSISPSDAPSSPSRPSNLRRRSSTSTLILAPHSPLLSGTPLTSTPVSPAVLSDALRRARLAKIHRLLGSEVGAEHVFAASPGAGPWLDEATFGASGSARGPGAGGGAEGKGGWKGVVEKARDTLGRSASAAGGGASGRREREPSAEGAPFTGAADERGGGIERGAGTPAGARIEGVKRGAKLSNIFGDFPPAELYHRALSPSSDPASSLNNADPARRTSTTSESSATFDLFEASIAELDRLLGDDGVGLLGAESSSSESDLSDDDDNDDAGTPGPFPGAEGADRSSLSRLPATAAAAASARARRRATLRKLARFFGCPPSAAALGPLFASTVAALRAGVEDERERGVLGGEEGEGLLGRLEGLRRRATRELEVGEPEVGAQREGEERSGTQ